LLRTDKGFIYSAQDLIAQFECDHRISLNQAASYGLIKKPKNEDPNLKLLQELGQLFEQRRLTEIERTAKVIKLSHPEPSPSGYQNAWFETRAAMQAGVDVIYQGTLFDGQFVGIVDFLLLKKDASGSVVRDGDGVAIYEPVDSKSARIEKVSAVIQVGAYANLLVSLGRPKPEQVHLWLAGEHDWSGDAGKAMAVAAQSRDSLLANPATGELPNPVWAPPRPSCASCSWQDHCKTGRSEARDLSLIQGIRSVSRERLVRAGISTIEQMSVAEEGRKPARLGQKTFENLKAQAEIQLKGEAQNKVLAELIDWQQLSQFPLASDGDIWFDMEGDPYADEGRGLEYMFGYQYLENGQSKFKTEDAFSLNEEKAAFERFIDFVMERWKRYPDLHIYHYADYERRALTKLSQKYSTRVAELDEILRKGLLIDMYSLIRKSIRFSTQSLSIKYVEAIYGESHGDEEVKSAKDSIVAFHAVQAHLLNGNRAAADAEYEEIRSYNAKDCKSTYDFDRWIRNFATENDVALGQKQVAGGDSEPKSASEYQRLADQLGELIESGKLDEESAQAIGLLRGALVFHEREDKVKWWRVFEAANQDLETLSRQTGAMVIGDVSAGEWATKSPKGRKLHRELRISGEAISAEDAISGEPNLSLIYEVAELGMMSPSDSLRGFSSAVTERFENGDAIISESQASTGEIWDSLPVAVIQTPKYNMTPLQDALAKLAAEVLAQGGLPAGKSWGQLLKREAPVNINHESGNHLADIVKTLQSGESMCVAVQGPPGTGKTFVGSRVVAQLAKMGWRIGVVAQSHAVVENFITKVIETDPSLSVGKKPKDKEGKGRSWEIDSAAEWMLSQPGGFVLGGTAWTFADKTVQAMGLDLLVVDEAGQFSVTMTLASAVGARRLLLLGDPQQLPQVSLASHPEGAEISALEHYAQGRKTLAPEVGFFLETTYRMHPLLTEKVSNLQYEGKLLSSPSVKVRNLDGVQPGVTPLPVEHSGNTTRSDEEAQKVTEIAHSLLGKLWTDNDGDRPLPARELDMKDIIVVAAFNDQVRAIRAALRKAQLDEIRVGTVDKFQGQEAAVVIVSMATSSEEDLPRGVEFLLSPNRLNVAVSRGKWVCYLIHSPELRRITPSSVNGLMNLGGFLELASEG
jgi:uncharacterized protein